MNEVREIWQSEPTEVLTKTRKTLISNLYNIVEKNDFNAFTRVNNKISDITKELERRDR